ncbi:MAG: FCD domain-containing protein, partial [Oscillospiraceae bacterium]|nr:FCD domain-containing protein [Oscillospiraceae bacterium]
KMLYNTRLYLELGTASLAVKNVTPEIIDRMQANYEAQKQLKSRFNIGEYAILNRDFHWAIAEASRNEYYQKFLSEIYNISHIYIVFYDDSVDNSRSLYTHGQMLQALRHRDEQELMAAIRLDNANAFDDLNAERGCGI